jgi:ABC-type lipoprotein export system ATPase subunit
MLVTKDLIFNYNRDVSFNFPDISIAEKESLLLLGSSGIGKTTLLHLLGGLMTPTSGQIVIDGQNLGLLSGKALDKFRGKNIGIVFQQNHFVESLNVIENILLAQSLISIRPDSTKAKQLLSRLNIGSKTTKKITELSQGERQRVAIARAIINNPKLILADEPTSALDDKNCVEVYQLLEEQANVEKASLVIVTHDNRLKSQVAKQINLI